MDRLAELKNNYVPRGFSFGECMRNCKNSLKQDKYMNKKPGTTRVETPPIVLNAQGPASNTPTLTPTPSQSQITES